MLLPRQPYTQGADFSHPWAAARLLLAGADPYRAIHAVTLPYGSVFFYPLPAAVVAIPFAGFRPELAASLFVALGCGLLAYAVTREHWWPLLLFLSVPMYRAIRAAQWSPLLTAAALLWPIVGLLAAKPQLAIPLLAYQRTRRALVSAVIGGGALCLVALILQPRWPIEWLAQIRESPLGHAYQIPILTPLGAPMLLAALRWRDPDARMLLAFACVPQGGHFYDQVPFLLIPRTRQSLLGAVLWSWVAYAPIFVQPMLTDVVQMSRHEFPFMLVGMYWPALVMVLRR